MLEERGPMMMWTGTWNGRGGSWAMLLGMVVFWGGLILAVGYVIRESRRSDARSDEPQAIQILEQRFARGEIDHDEFEERRRVLSEANMEATALIDPELIGHRLDLFRPELRPILDRYFPCSPLIVGRQLPRAAVFCGKNASTRGWSLRTSCERLEKQAFSA